MYKNDTTVSDSVFLALAETCLTDCVDEKLREEFFSKVYCEWFVAQSCQSCRAAWERVRIERRQTWEMGPCCQREYARQLRTPGLLKEEFEASKFICLNAKTYILVAADGKVKKSTKGIIHSLSSHLTWELFEGCLETGKPVYSHNRGFVVIRGNIFTYVQLKRALTNLLTKRAIDPRDPTVSHLLRLPELAAADANVG